MVQTANDSISVKGIEWSNSSSDGMKQGLYVKCANILLPYWIVNMVASHHRFPGERTNTITCFTPCFTHYLHVLQHVHMSLLLIKASRNIYFESEFKSFCHESLGLCGKCILTVIMLFLYMVMCIDIWLVVLSLYEYCYVVLSLYGINLLK